MRFWKNKNDFKLFLCFLCFLENSFVDLLLAKKNGWFKLDSLFNLELEINIQF